MPSHDARKKLKKPRRHPDHAPTGAVQRHTKVKAERRHDVSAAAERSATPAAKVQFRGPGKSKEPDAPAG